MKDNQFARCGAKADRFPFNKSPIVENMFSTGTEDALWLSVSLASSCSSGNLLELLHQKESGSSSSPSGSHRMYAFIWSRSLEIWVTLRRDGVFLNQFHFLAQRSRWYVDVAAAGRSGRCNAAADVTAVNDRRLRTGISCCGCIEHVGFGPVERKPVRTKAQQNEIPIERSPIRTTTRQKESPTERKAQFEPVYNKLCVGTVFAASCNVTTET